MDALRHFSRPLDKRFLKSRFRLGLVTPKSCPGLGLGPLRLESRSRQCSDVGKAHRCCKYVMILSKKRLFVGFFSHSGVMAFLKLV